MVEIAAIGNESIRERFTGKELDKEGASATHGIEGMNLQYFGRRYLDPDIGVWTTIDPQVQFWSPYAYSGNGLNCINAIDNNGGYLNIISGVST
jgi:RHS repeat-associated protein